MPSDFDIWRSSSGNPDNDDNEFVGIVSAEDAADAVAIAQRTVECQPPAVLWAEESDRAGDTCRHPDRGMKITVVALALCQALIEIVALRMPHPKLMPGIASLIAAAASITIALVSLKRSTAFLAAGVNAAVMFGFQPIGTFPLIFNTLLLVAFGLVANLHSEFDDDPIDSD